MYDGTICLQRWTRHQSVGQQGHRFRCSNSSSHYCGIFQFLILTQPAWATTIARRGIQAIPQMDTTALSCYVFLSHLHFQTQPPLVHILCTYSLISQIVEAFGFKVALLLDVFRRSSPPSCFSLLTANLKHCDSSFVTVDFHDPNLFWRLSSGTFCCYSFGDLQSLWNWRNKFTYALSSLNMDI